eukprot:4830430-Pleurochrysis_carterae.AAC.3
MLSPVLCKRRGPARPPHRSSRRGCTRSLIAPARQKRASSASRYEVHGSFTPDAVQGKARTNASPACRPRLP